MNISFALENASLFITSSFLLLRKCFCNPKRTVVMDFLVYHVPSALRTSRRIFVKLCSMCPHWHQQNQVRQSIWSPHLCLLSNHSESFPTRITDFVFLESFSSIITSKSWSVNKANLAIFRLTVSFAYFRVFVNRRWSPSAPNKYKTFIQSGRGTNNPRKRFTSLNSQITGKGEK